MKLLRGQAAMEEEPPEEGGVGQALCPIFEFDCIFLLCQQLESSRLVLL